MYPTFGFRRREYRIHPWWGDFVGQHRRLADWLLGHIANQGPVRSLDLGPGSLPAWANDDAIEYIETLLEGSGGFGSLIQLAHNWADFEATRRSYELIARYVMPRFQHSNRLRDISYTCSRDNKQNFQGQAAQAVQSEIDRYQEKQKGRG